jgi:hypothetical protein
MSISISKELVLGKVQVSTDTVYGEGRTIIL